MAVKDNEKGSTRRRGLAVRPGEGETIRIPFGGQMTFMARGGQTNGALMALHIEVAPGEGPPLHVHSGEEESVWVVEGDLRFKLDGEVWSTPPGSFVFIPRGVAHCFQNVGETPGRIVATFTPAGMEHFFEGLAGVTTFDPVAYGRVAGEAGMTVVGPPLAESEPLRPDDQATNL